jgi:hypothetical protein
MLALEQRTCSGGPPPLAWLGGLLRAHRPVAAAEDAGGHVSRTGCGRFLVLFQMAAQGPAQVEVGGIPWAAFTRGFQD